MSDYILNKYKKEWMKIIRPFRLNDYLKQLGIY